MRLFDAEAGRLILVPGESRWATFDRFLILFTAGSNVSFLCFIFQDGQRKLSNGRGSIHVWLSARILGQSNRIDRVFRQTDEQTHVDE